MLGVPRRPPLARLLPGLHVLTLCLLLPVVAPAAARLAVGNHTLRVASRDPRLGVVSRRFWVTHVPPGDGSGADAYAALAMLEAVDPVPPSLRATTPLFSLGVAPRPSTHADISLAVRRTVAQAGESPAGYSGRSLRVGGATELAARGAPSEAIRLLGRWDSDEYRAYTRVSHSQALRLSAAMGRSAAPMDPTLEATFPGFHQP